MFLLCFVLVEDEVIEEYIYGQLYYIIYRRCWWYGEVFNEYDWYVDLFELSSFGENFYSDVDWNWGEDFDDKELVEFVVDVLCFECV